MDKVLNRMLAGLSTPFPQLSPDKIFLVLDDRGNADPSFKSIFRTYHEPLLQYILENGPVFKVFDFGSVRSLREACGGSRDVVFRIRPGVPQEAVSIERFYTDFPLAVLRVYPMGRGRWLGVVSVLSMLPALFLSRSSAVLCLDERERIRAFNAGFHRVFEPVFPKPEPLLNAEAGALFTPTPAQVENGYLGRARASARSPWKTLFSNLKEGWGWALPRNKIIVEKDGRGVRVENPGEIFEILPLPVSVNTLANDFRFSVRADIESGGGPQLIVSPPLSQTREPAGEGYQAGPGAYPDTGWALKRRGFSHKEAGVPLPRGRTGLYTLENRKRALFFHVNGKEALAAWDPAFLFCASTCFFIGVRSRSRFRLSGITLEERACAGPGETLADEELIAETRFLPRRHFSMSRFYNRYFSGDYRRISGYVLNEVTILRERANLYRARFEEEKAKGDRLESLLSGSAALSEAFIGESASARRIKEQAALIADADAPVLIEGATGTGKEVLARHIHGHGSRREAPFVKVDCSALPGNLIESELFGYEKGAFTGALTRKEGRFELAQGGTLFLDEIGNLSLTLQAKLVSVLNDYAFTRLGGNASIRLDVRLITASNVPIPELISRGLFRKDLFYRINTVRLTLPPLSERREDIPLLCRHFLYLFSAGAGKKITDLTPAAYRKLSRRKWPGNVREMRNVLQRAYLYCEKGPIGEELIPEGEEAPVPDARRHSHHLVGMTKEKWRELLKKYNGRVAAVAAELRISRKACYDNFRKCGISPAEFR